MVEAGVELEVAATAAAAAAVAGGGCGGRGCGGGPSKRAAAVAAAAAAGAAAPTPTQESVGVHDRQYRRLIDCGDARVRLQAAAVVALVRMVAAAGQVGMIRAGAADGRRGGGRQVFAVVGGGGVRFQVPGSRLRREAARHRAGYLHFVHAGRVAGRVGGVAEAKAFRLLARRDKAGVTRRESRGKDELARIRSDVRRRCLAQVGGCGRRQGGERQSGQHDITL